MELAPALFQGLRLQIRLCHIAKIFWSLWSPILVVGCHFNHKVNLRAYSLIRDLLSRPHA